MKILIVLAGFVVVASAGRSYSNNGAASSYGSSGPSSSYGSSSYGAVQQQPIATHSVLTGQSSQFRQDDHYGNYHFGYDESHASGATSRREEQHNGVRRGSYSLSDADGRLRTVNYVADNYGFRATVHTNEPGVEPKDSADVQVTKKAGYSAPQHAPATNSYATNGNSYATSGNSHTTSGNSHAASGSSYATSGNAYASAQAGPTAHQLIRSFNLLAGSRYGSAVPNANFDNSYGARARSFNGQTQSYSAPAHGAHGQSFGSTGQSYGAPAHGQSFGSTGQSYGASAQAYGSAAQSYGSDYSEPQEQSYGAHDQDQTHDSQDQSYSAPAQSYGSSVQSHGGQSQLHGGQSQSYGGQSYGGQGQSYGGQAQSHATPRAFSYSFGTHHLAPVYATSQAANYGPAPAAPVHQQRLDY